MTWIAGLGTRVFASFLVLHVLVARTLAQRNFSCYEANIDDFRFCEGYARSGYTCVGELCAGLDPKGDPEKCASKSPDGYVVDQLRGRCVNASTLRCYDARVSDYRFCEKYPKNGYTCVGDYCAGINPLGHPSKCAKKRPEGWEVDKFTGKCVPAKPKMCYEAYKPNFRLCKGYEEVGYTCVGDWCAGVDPAGDPNLCAIKKPAGWSVDLVAGRCVENPVGVYYKIIHPEIFQGKYFLLTLALVILFGYLCGSIMGAYIIGRAKGLDCRKHATCNVGAINTKLITGSKIQFFYCFLIDSCKTLLPTYFWGYYFGLYGRPITVDPYNIRTNVCWILIGFSSLYGHIYPFYLKFEGGRAQASTVGMMVVIHPYFNIPLVVLVLVYFLPVLIGISSDKMGAKLAKQTQGKLKAVILAFSVIFVPPGATMLVQYNRNKKFGGNSLRAGLPFTLGLMAVMALAVWLFRHYFSKARKKKITAFWTEEYASKEDTSSPCKEFSPHCTICVMYAKYENKNPQGGEDTKVEMKLPEGHHHASTVVPFGDDSEGETSDSEGSVP